MCPVGARSFLYVFLAAQLGKGLSRMPRSVTLLGGKEGTRKDAPRLDFHFFVTQKNVEVMRGKYS